MPAIDWLAVLREEYLQNFISNGGAAIKFVVPSDDAEKQLLLNGLRATYGMGAGAGSSIGFP